MPDPSTAAILAPDGPLAAAIGPNFESRPEQIAMASEVADAMERRAHLLVEAGTGVGKSFAYLVPAILRCVFHDERVVVSTHTIALQEQLVQKDIPLLQAALENAGIIPRPERAENPRAPSTAPRHPPSPPHPLTPSPPHASSHPLRPVLVKGRGNYVSIRRLKLASARQEVLFAGSGARVQLHQIEDWAYQTTDGTRATLPRLEHPEVWTHVESDSDNCMGAKCPHNAECFYQNARRAMEKANLLVCNHALFFSDLALRARETGFLPRYDHVVLDEAHAAEDAAAEHLGMSLSEGRVQFLLRTLFDARRARGYLVQLVRSPLSTAGDPGAQRAIELVQDAGAAAAQFFDDWRRLVESGGLPSGRVRRPGAVENVLTPALKELALRLHALRESVGAEADKFELNAYARRAADLALGAEAFVNQTIGVPDRDRSGTPGACVYWVETGGAAPAPGARARSPRITLACAPIDAAPLLRDLLFKPQHSVTLTSATLATGGRVSGDRGIRASGGTAERRVVPIDAPDQETPDEDGENLPARTAPGPFRLVMSRLGCEGARTLLLGSPFDYARQMEVHIERDAPDPRGGRTAEQQSSAPRAPYEDRLASLILAHLDATDGGAFVLFNSFSALRRVGNLLAAPLAEQGMPLLIHDPEAPRSELLRRFKEDPRSVLLGAASFWQGVDVPGRALRNVIIAQLPFEPPDRPLTEARLELLASRGGDPFRDDSLPRAVIRFKQGIGRLIRSKTDTGRVVILDPRVVTKGYGRAFLNALPEGVRYAAARAGHEG